MAQGIWLVAGALLLSPTVVGYGTPGRLVLTNAAATAILGGTVAVCDNVYAIKAIKPGRSQGVIYKVRGDCHFDLKVRFANGKVLHDEFGYVTGGMLKSDHYDVTETGVTYRQ